MVVPTHEERYVVASAGDKEGTGAKLRLVGGLGDPAWPAAGPSRAAAPGSAETLPG